MNNLPKKLRKQLADDPLYKKCLKCGSSSVQWHHVFTYQGRQIQEKWAILPACPDCHAKATPHNFKYDPATRYFFELVAIKRMTQGTKAKYNKRCWDIERKWIENYLQNYVSSL